MYLDTFVEKANKIIFSYPDPMSYLNKRGITEYDIKKFSLGYVKSANMKVCDSDDYIYIKEATYGFRGLQNRIVIPLRNILGHTNGLIVRDITKKHYVQYFLKEAKNIGAFFGLYEALPHIFKTKKVFVHEGAFNSISFSKVFPNSIACLTSILNENQYELLLMFASKIILVFDADDPGSYGMSKIFERFGDKHITTVSLGYNDTNDCYQKMDLEKFKKYITNKVPILLRD